MMSPIIKFTKLYSKLKELCSEYHLNSEIDFKELPFILTLKPITDKDQVQMEGIDNNSINPDSRFCLKFVDGAVSYEVDKEFAISGELLNKVKNMFLKICTCFLEIYFSEEFEHSFIKLDSFAEHLLSDN